MNTNQIKKIDKIAQLCEEKLKNVLETSDIVLLDKEIKTVLSELTENKKFFKRII